MAVPGSRHSFQGLPLKQQEIPHSFFFSEKKMKTEKPNAELNIQKRTKIAVWTEELKKNLGF